MSDKRMQRLTLPRARAEPGGVAQPIPEAITPLPRWQTIPLDSKFPVVPAPKGEVTFVTNKLGEKRYISNQKTDFDLSDPYNRGINNEYNALFDPYLKGWFSKPHIQKQMRETGMLTERGNVPVSVRDFNEYRLYLRKQAVMKEGKRAVVVGRVDKVKERKQAVLAKTKMKAEVFGLEVKYRKLKAEQTSLEQEEEKRIKYHQKTASFEERQKRKIIEDAKRHANKMKERQSIWLKKQDKIKEKELAVKQRAEQMLIQFEMEVQDKLNKLDYLREQRFQVLDQRRKQKWRVRRMHQLYEMREAKKQKQRVEAEMRTIKQRYENQMARQAAKNEAALNLAKESRNKKKEQDNETYARRIAQVLKNTRYEVLSLEQNVHPTSGGETTTAGDGALTRKASTWMVQEVLNRLGLTEESWRLKTQGMTYTYVSDMDAAISSAVRRLESITVLGEEQEMLSRIIHLVWRAVKAAYPEQRKPPKTKSFSEKADTEEEGEEEEAGKESRKESENVTVNTEQSTLENTLDEELTTGEQLSWFFPDDDDNEETEQAIKISMLMTGDIERSYPVDTMLGDQRPKAAHAQKLVDTRMDDFFKSRMRMTETDALAMEEELLRFLDTLKMNEANPDERKKILDMCIHLANHDVIKKSDPCGEIETNPEGLVFLAFGADKSETSSVKGASRKSSIQSRRASFSILSKHDTDSQSSKKDTAIIEEVETVDSETHEVGSASRTAEGNQVSPGAGADAELAAGAEADASENANTRSRNKSFNRNQNNTKPAKGSSRSNSSCSTRTSSVSNASDDRAGGTKDENSSKNDKNQNQERKHEKHSEKTESDGFTSTSETENDEDDLDSASSGSTDVSEHKAQILEDYLTDNPNVNENRGGRNSVSFNEGRNISRNMMDDDQPPNEEMEGEAQKEDTGDQTQADEVGGQSDQTQNDEVGGQLDQTQNDEVGGQLDQTQNDEVGGQLDQTQNDEGNGLAKNEGVARSEKGSVVEDNVEKGKPPGSFSFARSSESARVDWVNRRAQSSSGHVSVGGAFNSDESIDDDNREEIIFVEAVASDDIVAVTQQMLLKIQSRENAKGVSIPQSRLLRFIAMNLSRLWQPGPDEHIHQFGRWLKDPTTSGLVHSLIYNIKRRQFPEELQRILAKGIVSECLRGITEPGTALTDGLVKIVLKRFLTDLEQDQVSIAVLEKVLLMVVQEYDRFIQSDLPFNSSVLLLDCLGFVYDKVTEGQMTKKGHILPAVRNWDQLSLDTRDNLECGNWPNMLHQASVVIRLNMLTNDDQNRIMEMLRSVCSEMLEFDAVQNMKEMLELARTRFTSLRFKMQFASEVAANTVVHLLDTISKTNIKSTTLLPGALNTSQSACTANSPSVLGPYSTGEAVIVLTLDMFCLELGTNKLSSSTQDKIAASLVDLLSSRYGRQRTELEGQGLTAAFKDIANQLDSYSLSYRDVKQLLATILRPYLTVTVKPFILKSLIVEDIEDENKEPPTLDEKQRISLVALVTQVFVSFIRFVTLRLKRAGVNMEQYSHRIMCLYTWRSIADLAKQSATVLGNVQDDYRNEKINNYVKPSDSLILERICRTVVDINDDRDSTVMSTVLLPKNSSRLRIMGLEPGTVASQLLSAVLEANPNPGFVPVADQFYPNKARTKTPIRTSKRRITREKLASVTEADPQDTIIEAEQRREATPGPIERALCMEIIAAARDIGDLLVTNKALRQLTTKTADSFAGMVFVAEKLLETLNDKLWSIFIKLQQDKISASSVVGAIVDHQRVKDLPHILLEKSATLKVLKQALHELEDQHSSAIALSRLVESLSRAAQSAVPDSDPAAEQLRRQPHPILASASPVLLAQWVRSCLLSALRAVTIILSGGKNSSAMKPPKLKEFEKDHSTVAIDPSSIKRPTKKEIDLDAIYLAASYTVVHNFLAQVRNATERQKNLDNLWMANPVAGTQECSQVGVPCEILDRVFARLAGVMETLAGTVGKRPEDNDGRVPERAYDVASVIISQVTSAVSYHVEIGRFPPIQINDLLRSANPPNNKPTSKIQRTPSRVSWKKQEALQKGLSSDDPNISENNRKIGADMTNWSLNNSFAMTLQDPISNMQGRWSSHLFNGLMDTVGRLDNTLKEAVEDSMRRRDSVTTDARVRARAFTSSILDKIKKHASSREILLYSGQVRSGIADTQRTSKVRTAIGIVPTPPLLPKRSSQNRGSGRLPVVSPSNKNANKARIQGGGLLNTCSSSTTKANVNNFPTTAIGGEKSTQLMVYVRSLLRPVSGINYGDIFSRNIGGGNVSNNKSIDVVSEILRAGYLVSWDLFREFELPRKTNKSEESTCQKGDSRKIAISILLLDLLLGNLSNSLEKQNKSIRTIPSSSSLQARPAGSGKKGGVPGASPYVSSYQYRTPDPLGPHYAEVVDRGRRWCQMVDVDTAPSALSCGRAAVNIPRIHSLTRNLLVPGAKITHDQGLTSAAVSGTQSGSSQPSSSSTQHDEQELGTKRGLGRNKQDRERRSSAWRKEVHKLSATYTTDNTNNSWRRRSQTKANEEKVSAERVRPTKVNDKGTHAGKILTKVTNQKSVQIAQKSSVGKYAGTRSKSLNSEVSRKKDVPKKPSDDDISSKKNPPKARTFTSRSISNGAKSLRAARETCTNPLAHGRYRDKGVSNDRNPKEKQADEKLNESTEKAEQQKPKQGNNSESETQAHQSRRREAQVQVFYHVPEQDVALAEEQLKKYRQSETEISEMDALSNLDLQLLMLALLSRDLPRETVILSACLRGKGRLKLSGLEIVADLLSLLDHVLEDLGEVVVPLDQHKVIDVQAGVDKGNQYGKGEMKKSHDNTKVNVKVRRLLKAASKTTEVSQRSAGAVHSLLRSLEYGLLSDDIIKTGLESCTSKVADKSKEIVNIQAIKLQMKTSLVQLVERLEEGHAPTDMTSSDWARLADEIIHQHQQNQQQSDDIELELHQSPSDCVKDDADDNGDDNECTEYDDMNSFEYFDQDREISEDLNTHVEEGKHDEGDERRPTRKRTSKKSTDRPAPGSLAKSRSSSRSAHRFTSKSPQRHRGRSRSSISSRSGNGEEGAANNSAKSHGSRSSSVGSWSPVRQTSASQSSMSRSSVTSMSSTSSSATSSSSAASRESCGSGRACAVTSGGKARHTQSHCEQESQDKQNVEH